MKLFLMILAAGIMWVVSPNLPTFQDVFNTQWLAPSTGETILQTSQDLIFDNDSNISNNTMQGDYQVKEDRPARDVVINAQEEQEVNIEQAEREAFDLINKYRLANNVPITMWDDELYELSKAHTNAMADRGILFHSNEGAPIGENAWGGSGFYRYGSQNISVAIAETWFHSPLHNAWLLHTPIKESVVTIVINPTGQYASWTFWMNKLYSGPALIEEIAYEWRTSGKGLTWLEYLKMKGYIEDSLNY